MREDEELNVRETVPEPEPLAEGQALRDGEGVPDRHCVTVAEPEPLDDGHTLIDDDGESVRDTDGLSVCVTVDVVLKHKVAV